jgi:hypothetical protein
MLPAQHLDNRFLGVFRGSMRVTAFAEGEPAIHFVRPLFTLRRDGVSICDYATLQDLGNRQARKFPKAAQLSLRFFVKSDRSRSHCAHPIDCNTHCNTEGMSDSREMMPILVPAAILAAAIRRTKDSRHA